MSSLTLRRRRNVAVAESSSDTLGGGQCPICDRHVHPADQRRHLARSTGAFSCHCIYHVECLVLALQSGRSICDCGQPLSTDPIRVLIPRTVPARSFIHKVRGRGVSPSQQEHEEDMRSVGDECPICTHSLTTPGLAPIGRPSVCAHAFHLHCLLETAFTPARDRALDQSIDPDSPDFRCPLCRRQIIAIDAHGAPLILVDYEALEQQTHNHDGSFFGNFDSTGYGQQQQGQRNWWDVIEVVAEVAVGAAIIFAMILFARR